MKLVLLSLTLIWTTVGLAQDCFFCPPFRWRDFWPPIIVPEWPIEYVTINKPKYERNPKASFCKRPVEMIDTIVIHHSETHSTDSPEKINEYHLVRGTKNDPWYMIAYTYVINSPYPGASIPEAKVSEGRPIDIVGAHAGSKVFVPMDQEQKKLWDEGKITCGKENEEFKVDPTIIKNGKIKANVTTVGLVVIGNYTPYSDSNPNGYSTNPAPTQQTKDLIARMSCQLQKKYPRMKYLKWHSYYHPTSCPGAILKYINEIKTIARNYGCEFQ